MTNVTELTKQLISIPSYVGSDCDEQEIGNFIYEYLRQFPWLKVIKQQVADNRFNIIARDKYPTTTLFCGHIDTVEPRTGWETKPFEPTVENGKLYGLGATDMKGSLAAMLSSIANFKSTEGLMILCYIDEEYDFAGMKQFILDYKRKIRPKIIISSDGDEEFTNNGCRGLIEVSFTVKGKTGHAGRPELGINAILEGTSLIKDLTIILTEEYSDKILGSTTCNLAYTQGGLDLKKDKLGKQIYGKQGNNIANTAEFIIDIRPATTKLNAKKVEELVYQLARDRKIKVEGFSIRHDLGAWITPSSKLNNLPGAKSAKYQPSIGYTDNQMIWEALGRPPSCIIGAGISRLAHTPNEYVKIKSLEKTKKNFEKIIKTYTKGEIK